MVRDAKSTITFNDFYTHFKTWFMDNFAGMKLPMKNEVRTDMVNKWGDLVDGKWIGWRPRKMEDDILAGNVAVVKVPIA